MISIWDIIGQGCHPSIFKQQNLKGVNMGIKWVRIKKDFS